MKRIAILFALVALALSADSTDWQLVATIPHQSQKVPIYKFRDGVATCYVIVQQICCEYTTGGSSTISCIRNDR